MDANDMFLNISKLEIQEAKIEYQRDINTYPLFYCTTSLNMLNDPSFDVKLKTKLNKFYTPSQSKSFQIPYDLLSNRIVVYQNIEDLILKYIIKKIISRSTGFQESNEILLNKKIMKFNETTNESPEYIFKIDIFNFFDSIKHENILKIIARELNLELDSDLMCFIQNSLRLNFKDNNGEIITLGKGLILGNKPDEFFADFYLTNVIKTVSKKTGIEIINIADEILFKATEIKRAREIYAIIEQELNSQNLFVNKSKNKVINYNPAIIAGNQELKITFNELFLDTSAGAFPIFFKGNERNFEIIKKEDPKINSGQEINKNLDDLNQNNDDYTHEINNKHREFLLDFEIKDYESSINFIKHIIESQDEIMKYQRKYPDFKKFHNIVFSQPKDFLIDFEKMNFCLFDREILKKLVYIIYKYPRSEYYSAIAINLLIFALKNSSFCINHRIADNSDIQLYERNFNHLKTQLTDVCEFTNYTVLELLKSNDLHEYQKYLILRSIFKNKNDYRIDINNYIFEAYDYEGDLKFENLPFKKDLINIILQLNSSNRNFALNEITSDLANILK